MTHLADTDFQAKAPLYKTAQAVIGCAAFKKGEYVAVSYSHSNSSHWFNITKTEKGELSQPVCYPAQHLNNFTL